MKVEDVSLAELRHGLRQHNVSFMIFHQNGPAYHHIDLVRLEKEECVSRIKLEFYYIHDLSLPV